MRPREGQVKVTIVAFGGMQGAGKDTQAECLKPLGYKQFAFSTPMYRIAKLSQQREGNSDRFAPYELFNQCIDLFGGVASAPPFAVTSALVSNSIPQLYKSTGAFDIMARGTKPRAFLQGIGDTFRSFDSNIFSEYLSVQIMKDTRKSIDSYLNRLEMLESGALAPMSRGDLTGQEQDDFVEIDDPTTRLDLSYVVTDMRYPQEHKAIAELANRLPQFVRSDLHVRINFIKLDITEKNAIDRVCKRDNVMPEMVKQSLLHSSEQALPDSMYDHIIDGNLSIEDVSSEVRRILADEKEIPCGILTENLALEMIDGVIDLSKYRSKEEN
jgi:dephospho-CoA kinase